MQATVENGRARRWQFLREALAGTQQDFTRGNLSRGIALLAIPTVLEMAMEATFGVVDAFWVARLGSDAIAAVGLTEALVILIFSIALGLSMGVTATVSRRIGEKDAEGASVAAAQGIGCGIAVSIVTGTLGAIFAPQLLALMHADSGVILAGSHYTRIVLGGSATIYLLFLINAAFRGAGDAALAMRTLWLSNLINIVLDPCLIFGWFFFPKLGIAGAAVATTTGRGIGVLYQLWTLFGGRARLALARRHLRLEWGVLGPLLRTSSTAMLQYFIATASWLSLARINASFGSVAVAGYTIAIRIILFAILPSWGIASAAATLVGQNLGARQPDRAERTVWIGGAYNMALLTGVGAALFIFAGRLVRIFTPDTAVESVAVSCLRIVSLGYPFYAWGMLMEQAFNGAGDSWTPTRINLFCYWLFQIPLAWYLSHAAGMGPKGVYWAICGAESVLAIVSAGLFRQGKWKEVKI